MNDFTIDSRIVHDSPLSASARIPGPTANGCTHSRKRSQGHPGARSGAETIVK